MQLASEPEHYQPRPGDEHLSEAIGYNDNHLDQETLKAANEVNRAESLVYTSSEKVACPPLLRDEPTLAHTDVEDSANSKQNNGGHKAVPYSFSHPRFEIVGKATEFYMDKGVTDIELPKMIVCYKEGSYHIIKDVRVDEGVHSFDKILLQNEAEEKKSCAISQSDRRDEYAHELHVSVAPKLLSLKEQPVSEVKDDAKQDSLCTSPKKREDTSDTLDETSCNETIEKRINERMLPQQEPDLHQFQEHTLDVHNDNLKQLSLASLLEVDRNKPNITGETVHPSEIERLLTAQEYGSGHCNIGLSNSESNHDQRQLIRKGIDQPLSVNGDRKEAQYIKCESHLSQCVRDESGDCVDLSSTVGNTYQLFSTCDSSNREHADEITRALEESNSTILDVSSEEPKEGNEAKSLSGMSKSGSNIISFYIDPELPAAGSVKDVKGISEFQQSGLATSVAALEGTSTDGPGASAWKSQNYHGQSEPDFLGPASLSGRITHAGQKPYSGSVSLRSDSSTTSTRSFAFPVLQSEWNASPVRMARADRRHLKKHRFWRSGLLCCKF